MSPEASLITRSTRAKLFAMALLTAIAFAFALVAYGRIEQLQSYHAFADTRSWWGIANAANVLSNLGFLVVGGLALRRIHAPARHRWALRALFIGITLTGFGSAYYHWAPSDSSLVWDRAPMSLAFAALAAYLFERISGAAAPGRLALALGSGLAATAWWQFSGDLRPYIFVQGYPLICIACLTAWAELSSSVRCAIPTVMGRALALAFLCYAAAKLAEYFDDELYAWSGTLVSGHALKHLLAALSCWALLPLIESAPLRRSSARPRRPHPVDADEAAAG